MSEKKFERKKKSDKVETGEYRLKHGYGKHNIGERADCKIKGKKHKRIVEGGDILVCPVGLVAAFHDKFVRVDTVPEKVEPEQSKLIKEHKGGGRYNVLNFRTGVKLNGDVFLSKEEAEEMIDEEGAQEVDGRGREVVRGEEEPEEPVVE